jgi:AcrR family transcriptional regulator
MVQVKKAAILEAINRSAFDLFSENGYSRTTVAQIAKLANITTSNFYRYYDTKLDVLFAVFAPWLRGHLDALEDRVAKIEDPRTRLRSIFLGIWRDIPRADNGFNNNIIEALAAFSPDERYSKSLLLESEKRLSQMFADCVPPDRLSIIGDNKLAHLMFMGGDGFAINVKLGGPSPPVEGIADMMCTLVLGGDNQSSENGGGKNVSSSAASGADS